MKKIIAALVVLTALSSTTNKTITGKSTGDFSWVMTTKKNQDKNNDIILNGDDGQQYVIKNAIWMVVRKSDDGIGTVITTLLKQGTNGDGGIATITVTLTSLGTASFVAETGDVGLQPDISVTEGYKTKPVVKEVAEGQRATASA